MVPAKHGVDSGGELVVVRFVNTARVDPNVLQAIAAGLFRAEPDLVVARLSLAGTIHQVFEVDLVGLCSPCVRKYGVSGNIIVSEVLEAEFASAIAF